MDEDIGDSKQPESVAAVLKVFAILNALGERSDIGITDLSVRLAMPKATVYRFLQTMKSLGYVRQEADSERYGLAMSMFESKTYSQLLPDGKAWRFHFLQEVKSFITHPSFGQSLKEPGYYQISGVAYSGNGRISKVTVSADGGKSWADAAIQGPAQDKAFTRFHMPWRWDGQPAVLTSRAVDSGGNIQPLRADFVAHRGQSLRPSTNPLAFGNNHYNSLTCWGINEKGEIAHVYI